MHPKRAALIALGICFCLAALAPATCLAQAGPPDIVGGGSVIQYTSTEGPAPAPSTLSFDTFLAQRFTQARLIAARWLAASRPAGARAASPLRVRWLGR